jgi:hypothetical protein
MSGVSIYRGAGRHPKRQRAAERACGTSAALPSDVDLDNLMESVQAMRPSLALPDRLIASPPPFTQPIHLASTQNRD